jgi:hypothetical protein
MIEYSACDLDDIIQKLNGGKIRPIGETYYDKEALKRQETIQHLADILIEDILRVTECKGNESSVEKAKNKAFGWVNQLIEMLEENFDIKMVRREGESEA